MFRTDYFDSRVKSKSWDDKTVFRMRKIGIKDTYDAGVYFRANKYLSLILQGPYIGRYGSYVAGGFGWLDLAL